MYVPTDYPDGNGELWWLALEKIVACVREVQLRRDGELWRLPAATTSEKYRAFEKIKCWLRRLDEDCPAPCGAYPSPIAMTSIRRRIVAICPPIIATNPLASTAGVPTIIAVSIWSKFERALIICLTRICRKPPHDRHQLTELGSGCWYFYYHSPQPN